MNPLSHNRKSGPYVSYQSNSSFWSDYRKRMRSDLITGPAKVLWSVACSTSSWQLNQILIVWLQITKMECDSGSDLPVRPEEPPPETGGGEGDASSSLLPAVAPTVAPNLPVLPLLPLAARLHKLSCETASEEPKAGPSNSAAQFDLEVCPLVFITCAFNLSILEERVCTFLFLGFWLWVQLFKWGVLGRRWKGGLVFFLLTLPGKLQFLCI